MARKCFFSFHYKPDNWRASQVRNMGMVEGNPAVSDNDWESITKGGDSKIQQWIDDQINGKSCAIILIGTNTAGRKWIDYEITKSWNSKKGVLGIYVHNLKDKDGNQCVQGSNPFSSFTIGEKKKQMTDIVKTYNPPYLSSTDAYNYIKENLANWADKAVEIRNNF